MENDLGGFNPIFVFIVYAVVWLLLFGYVFYMARRQGDVRADIEALKREMAERRGSEGRGEVRDASA